MPSRGARRKSSRKKMDSTLRSAARVRLRPEAVEELDQGLGGIAGGDGDVQAAGGAGDVGHVAGDGGGHGAEVEDVGADGHEAGDDGALHHAGDAAGIAGGDHLRAGFEIGAVGGAELGGELRGDLHVGEPADAVGAEEHAGPLRAPDQAHGDFGAALGVLVGPDADFGHHGGAFFEQALVADHRAFLDVDVALRDDVAADDGAAGAAAGAEVGSAPEHGVGDLARRPR